MNAVTRSAITIVAIARICCLRRRLIRYAIRRWRYVADYRRRSPPPVDTYAAERRYARHTLQPHTTMPWLGCHIARALPEHAFACHAAD